MHPSRHAISAFIICKNEEGRIRACIESLARFDEIVIVDSGSEDGTLQIVGELLSRGFPIRLIRKDWRGFAAQKQFALEQCSNEWCFSIDCDERIDSDLDDELGRLIAAPEHVVGWRIARRPYLPGFGYTPKRVQERRNLRLFRRSKGEYDVSQSVHEGFVPEGEVRDCKTGSILHFRALLIGDQILTENLYSTLKADMVVDREEKRSKWRLLFNPPLYFGRLYLRHGLWRCGFPGFIQAATGAVYSFLTEAKIYQRRAIEKKPPRDDVQP